MKNVIVGTAGHIDHGKTCLIRAMTDIDTDRLKEEKQRGITIELGFADLPNDRGLDIGIIDVPGHEKFVRHMLAGIGGIDLVLLIVAADEGFMPQTAEHFEILKMLRISRGIVVITKIDLVDQEWMEVIREDVRDHVAGSFLEGAPVMEVSSQTGEGIEALKELILQMAQECGSRREDRRLLRLPIDRVFTIDGFGTVITGTLMEGSVETGDEIMLYPCRKKARVRNLQVHGRSVKEARAGQRTAINLSGIKKEEIARGDVAAAPGLLFTTRILDVRIDLFDNTRRMLKSGGRFHFHYGSAETLCKAVLLDRESLSKGESGYAQLRFEEEIAVKRGDRFILRFYSPMETIGGGQVLNPSPKKKKRFDETALLSLRIQDGGDEGKALAEFCLQESGELADVADVVRKFGKTEEEVSSLVETLLAEKELVRIGEGFLLHEKYVRYAAEQAAALVEAYHRENPVLSGMQKEEFRMKFSGVLHSGDMKKIEGLIRYLLRQNVIQEAGGTIARKGFAVAYTDAQLALLEELTAKYRDAGLQPPATEEVVEAAKDKKLTQQLLEGLWEQGRLEKLDFRHYIDGSALAEAMEALKQAIERGGSITLAQYRDLLGVSRKYAMMLLEYADADGITRMTGESRVLNR